MSFDGSKIKILTEQEIQAQIKTEFLATLKTENVDLMKTPRYPSQWLQKHKFPNTIENINYLGQILIDHAIEMAIENLKHVFGGISHT